MGLRTARRVCGSSCSTKARTQAQGPKLCALSPTRERPMDFCLSDEQLLLRKSVREFAETEIRPHVREWDDRQHFPSELVPALAALGLMGIQIPESYGGTGMSAVDYCICIEELARV